MLQRITYRGISLIRYRNPKAHLWSYGGLGGRRGSFRVPMIAECLVGVAACRLPHDTLPLGIDVRALTL